MRILLTGASSFTGFWFARMLNQTGHHVVAALRRETGGYIEGVRAERVARLSAFAEVVHGVSFGGQEFLDLCRSGTWDLFCHHASQVGDYRAADFDIIGALTANTYNLSDVLRTMRGLRGMVLTGSYYEADEGIGTMPVRAFSAYGLSKTLTAQVVRFCCREIGLSLGKFVIPNPFGPFEEPRFLAYLIRQWKVGTVGYVRTPAYVRDNIHVDLLALAYAQFCSCVPDGAPFVKLNPSGYVETQGSYARRVAAEMQIRLGIECGLAFADQKEFPEPLMRINTDRIIADWDEASAWDGVANFYQ